MGWTSDLPSEPGWYWVCDGPGGEYVRPCEMWYDRHGEPHYHEFGEESSWILGQFRPSFWWYGPLEVPKVP